MTSCSCVYASCASLKTNVSPPLPLPSFFGSDVVPSSSSLTSAVHNLYRLLEKKIMYEGGVSSDSIHILSLEDKSYLLRRSGERSLDLRFGLLSCDL